MSTSIDFINNALALCGIKPATSLADGTPASVIAAAIYPGVFMAVLEEREWTFAKRRLQLVQDTNTPAFGYTHQYVLPGDIITVVRCYQGDSAAFGMPPILQDWVREGFRVLTNETDPVYAELIFKADEGAVSPACGQALVHRLAGEFAIPLTENAKLSDMHWKLYESLIVSAGASDGKQGTTQRLRPPPLPGRLQNL